MNLTTSTAINFEAKFLVMKNDDIHFMWDGLIRKMKGP